MKFSTSLFTVAFIATVSSIPINHRRDVPAALIPAFGHAANVNPTGTGNCDGAVNGANGKPIAVPCACPPDAATFAADLNANAAAGHATNNPSIAVSFPTDNSQASQLARINAALVTLQNLHGPGVGCPASSTTFVAQQAAIQAGTAAPPPAAAAPPPAAAAPANAASIASLVPSLGFLAGVNPTGTGNCDGAVNGANGKPIAIPCACPPSQADFNNDVALNVAAGKVVNNPGIPFSFPTDSSTASQLARVNAALVTLQNLHGPGVGCPASSSTLSAQQAALRR